MNLLRLNVSMMNKIVNIVSDGSLSIYFLQKKDEISRLTMKVKLLTKLSNVCTFYLFPCFSY